MAVATLFLATPISNISTSPLALKSAYTASAETYEDLTYEIINGEISITDCNIKVTEVVIPSEIDGLPVTSIGSWAFDLCSSLTSITIPDSVADIGDSAFWGCKGLTSITIPDSVTKIGEDAFYGCSGLTSITIPDSVADIGESAFWGCKSLTSITIPDSVTSIKKWTFAYCSNLTSITIPDSVTSIGDWAFNGCSSLTSIIVDENNQYYSDIDGVLFNKDKTNIISYPSGRTSKEYEIPDSVTSIGGSTFYGCTSLTSITIPDSVADIGDSAFWGCKGLTSSIYKIDAHPKIHVDTWIFDVFRSKN